MSKEKRIPIPTKWDSEWDTFAVSEQHALDEAHCVKSKQFDTFLRSMVNRFGACDELCAAYLWNKTEKNAAKHRKFIIEVIESQEYPVGTWVKVKYESDNDDIFSDLLQDLNEGDINGTEYDKQVAIIREGKPCKVATHENGFGDVAHTLKCGDVELRYTWSYGDLVPIEAPAPIPAIKEVKLYAIFNHVQQVVEIDLRGTLAVYKFEEEADKALTDFKRLFPKERKKWKVRPIEAKYC